MTNFEKFRASAEARRGTHGDHIDKLTGYFAAETNRLRGQQEATEPEAPETPLAPTSTPPSPPVKRVRWWRRGRVSS